MTALLLKSMKDGTLKNHGFTFRIFNPSLHVDISSKGEPWDKYEATLLVVDADNNDDEEEENDLEEVVMQEVEKGEIKNEREEEEEEKDAEDIKEEKEKREDRSDLKMRH